MRREPGALAAGGTIHPHPERAAILESYGITP